MQFAQEPVFQWLSQYAYDPTFVYISIVVIMFMSSFGFPIPEEVTIISVGLLAYMGSHPQHFPPPAPDLPVVNGFEAAFITLGAVFLSDMTVFFLGRTFGRQIITHNSMRKVFTERNRERIHRFVNRFGVYAAFIFRFTPGLRFPAHIFLGMSPFPSWQFALIDFTAALISVPTQILLIYYYGEPILKGLAQFKTVIFTLAGILIVYILVRKLIGALSQSKAT